MEINHLTGIRLEDIASTFTRSFSDYIIPVNVTPEILALKMLQEDLYPGHSAGAVDEGSLQGFMLHGCRQVGSELLFYNGGTGVLPESRGQSLTKRMYEWLIPVFKSKGANGILLEVVDINTRASHVYESLGFSPLRSFKCFRGNLPALEKIEGLSCAVVEPPDWTMPETWWSAQPCWSGQTQSMQNIQGTIKYVRAAMNGNAVGYLCILPLTQRIFQICVHPQWRRRGIGRQMLAKASEAFNLTQALAMNVDAADADTIRFFERLGWNITVTQIEMKLALPC